MVASNASGKPHCEIESPIVMTGFQYACWAVPKPLLKRRINPAAARLEDAFCGWFRG